ncbi:MAG: hypothetical protein HOV81_22390 [Kofleriaceae bacterium]|nr:hypothetical protein [Kofleriaceae bacterium]
MKHAVAFATVVALAASASADPLRLRADALASTQSPAGLLVLEADGAERPELSAEAVIWLAGRHDERDEARHGDVIVIAIKARTRGDRARGTIGRFVSTLGALRPVHVDGAALRLRLPKRFEIETVGGMPVVPASVAAGRAWDWLVGARLSRRLGDYGAIGVAYSQQRDAGRKVYEEVALDAGIALGKRDDLGARVAYDVANPGLAEVALTARHVHKPVRADLYVTHRAASHLLPATSLFTVIGDVPSVRAGALLTWPAAPRLDLVADLGARRVDSDVAPELVARARLKLDDRGASALTGELRRSGIADEAWTGARGAARIALPRSLALSTELELVIPDDARGRGTAWPWALAACSWQRAAWQSALAVEASASPEYRHRVDVLFQLARQWGVP